MDISLESFAHYAFCLDDELAILVLSAKEMKQNFD